MTDHAPSAPAIGGLPTPALPTAGILCGLGAAFIWGTWPVVTALGVKSDSLTAFQLVLLRFAVAAPLLLPFAFRGKSGMREWAQAFVMMLGAGFPYSLLVSSAFEHAPASHGGVIIPGTMLTVSVLLAHVWFGERLTRARLVGVAAILVGLGCLTVGTEGAMRGDLMFMAGGLMWAGYTFFFRRWPTDGLVIAARVSLLSLVLVAAGVAFGYADGIADVAPETIITQGFWQGVVSAILALVLFNKAVSLLGSGRAATLNALIPVVAVVLAFLVLHEVPSQVELLGLVAIIGGIAVAMGLKIRLRGSSSRQTQPAE